MLWLFYSPSLFSHIVCSSELRVGKEFKRQQLVIRVRSDSIILVIEKGRRHMSAMAMGMKGLISEGGARAEGRIEKAPTPCKQGRNLRSNVVTSPLQSATIGVCSFNFFPVYYIRTMH